MTVAGLAVAVPRALAGERAFAWANALLGLSFTLGLMVDLWAHNNVRPLFETFFTVWHAVLYGSFGLVAAFLAATAARSLAAGAPLRRALPRGYGLSGVGALVFGLGGGFDLAWHTFFGVEANIDAIVSPSHLLLATGGVLIASGAMRASREAWAVVVSMLATALFALPFLTLFEAPYAQLAGLPPRLDLRKEAEIFGMVSFSLVLVGVCLYALRAIRLPRGSLTFLVGGVGIVSATVGSGDLGGTRPAMMAAAVAAGVLADLLAFVVRPAFDRPASVVAFAALLPVALVAPYVAAVLAVSGMWWSVHSILGAIALPAAAGALLGSLSARSAASL